MKNSLYLAVVIATLFFGTNTVFADESTEQEIRTLRAENKLLRSTIKRQKKKIAELENKVKAMDSGTKKDAPTKTEIKKTQKNKAAKLITRTKLISIAKEYLHTPEKLTQVKRKRYRDKVETETKSKLIDQHIKIQGTLTDVSATNTGKFRVSVVYKKRVRHRGGGHAKRTRSIQPSNYIYIDFITGDKRVIDLEPGSDVTVEGVIDSYSIGSGSLFKSGSDTIIRLELKNGAIIKKGE
ncbi:MAG: hypothetical protein KAR11_01970 [Phycisphaerae bacterium]|nr:hypothetical protein [Phycisphaerae bacterium]